jgi:hypothetical protein
VQVLFFAACPGVLAQGPVLFTNKPNHGKNQLSNNVFVMLSCSWSMLDKEELNDAPGRR